MKPIKIGACLKGEEIADHRDWLFEADRDIELHEFMTHVALSSELDDRVAAAQEALSGHAGRVGIMGHTEVSTSITRMPSCAPSSLHAFLPLSRRPTGSAQGRWSCIRPIPPGTLAE